MFLDCILRLLFGSQHLELGSGFLELVIPLTWAAFRSRLMNTSSLRLDLGMDDPYSSTTLGGR